MYVFMYVRMYVRKNPCLYVCMYVYVCVCVCYIACMHHICFRANAHRFSSENLFTIFSLENIGFAEIDLLTINTCMNVITSRLVTIRNVISPRSYFSYLVL